MTEFDPQRIDLPQEDMALIVWAMEDAKALVEAGSPLEAATAPLRELAQREGKLGEVAAFLYDGFLAEQRPPLGIPF